MYKRKDPMQSPLSSPDSGDDRRRAISGDACRPSMSLQGDRPLGSPRFARRAVQQSHRAKLAHWFYVSSPASRTIDAMQVVVSLLSGAVFVAGTYIGERQGFAILGYAISFFCILDFILRLYLAESRLRHLMGIYAIVDIVTLLPLLLREADELNATFDSVVRLLQVLRVVRLFRLSAFTNNALQNEIFTLVFIVFCLVFISTSIICTIEPWPLSRFHTSLYFVIVTIMTVGYGDFAARTEAGRAVVMILLIATLIIVPIQTQHISNILGHNTQYSGYYHRQRRHKHIIVTGHITLDNLTGFLEELYHEDRAMRSDVHCVLLMKNKPNTFLKTFIRSSKMEGRLYVLMGNALTLCMALKRFRKDITISAQIITTQSKEIYACPMPDCFAGRMFYDVVIYKQYGATLFALSTEKDGATVMTLNPGRDYVTTGREVALLLAQDENVIAHVQGHDTSDEAPLQASRRRVLSIGRRKKPFEVSMFPSLSSSKGSLSGSLAASHTSVARRALGQALCSSCSARGHTIVCSAAIGGLRLFLEELRTQLTARSQIVVLCSEPPTEADWEQLAYIPDLFVVVGTAMYFEDLRRAGVESAEHVIFLSPPMKQARDESGDDTLADADTILAYNNLQRNTRLVPRVIVDLVALSNAKFFRPKRLPAKLARKCGLLFVPSVASGRVVCMSAFDAMLAQTYFNPYITSVMQSLLENPTDSADDSLSYLQQIPLPVGTWQTYGELFEELLARGALPLGLYRCRDAKGSLEPYVFTNPPPETLLAREDLVFCTSEQSSECPEGDGSPPDIESHSVTGHLSNVTFNPSVVGSVAPQAACPPRPIVMLYRDVSNRPTGSWSSVSLHVWTPPATGFTGRLSECTPSPVVFLDVADALLAADEADNRSHSRCRGNRPGYEDPRGIVTSDGSLLVFVNNLRPTDCRRRIAIVRTSLAAVVGAAAADGPARRSVAATLAYRLLHEYSIGP
eukprot:m51a1_g7282 putative cation channel family protein (969) ;mRNA; f:19045-26498